MRKKIRTRVLITLIITLAGLALIFKPHKNPDGTSTSWTQWRENLADNINLGLDLRGGSHLVMRVEADDYIKKLTDRNVETVRGMMTGISPDITVETVRPGVFQVNAPDSSRGGDIINELQTLLGDGWTYSEQGNSVIASITEFARNAELNRATDQALQIITNRIDQFGVAEPTVQRHGGEGTYQILVQMPGVDDPERVKNTLNADSNLELRLQAKATTTYPSEEAAKTAMASLPGGPENYEIFPYRERGATDDVTPVTDKQWVILNKEVVISGIQMRAAEARAAQQGGGRYEIAFSLTPEGATRFADVTGANINEMLSIVLNNEVKSIARIESQIRDQGQITGSFTKRQAEDIALVLRSGALPAKMVYLEERTVGPSLGADSIRQGVTASIAGLLAVIAVMLYYYRGSGINAVLALILNLVLLLAAIVAFNATLTLPGIAGVILTIGMAVDSNILIFERIREELRNGKVVASAVDVGFDKAFLTIIDTHVTTIVSAIFLFVFGTGPIRGFAVTLVAGLVANVFTAVFVSKTIFMWHLNRRARVESISI
jgi:preprotein translocase subunit SecD